ncbi:Alpha-1,4-glucan:maltose-1-phosphate maltosyltransferase 2 [Candidatus Izimaplasma bacterium HR1]|uniref:alpha-amylase family glycosyl hydrolase n=1 Tax=Candidatus Izimoplasma sp. HR1 TaxID=1541959 RepID=UPI0004F6C28B|nr:Alpha-1,4-glucan:maltose-1-phosphate maltosyltransferase 2 [Candidatus Izimaplasma bacterium HR1]
MSIYTNKELRKLFFYQVYIRNHTQSGTFKEFITDLDRIKELGVDVVYLLPIHEIGIKQRKGDLGCPYSIKDFRSINHEYGTFEDFEELVNEVHKRGMKLMIDVVFNHTSYDSVLLEKHPEYFYKKDGKFANRVGDWWDITDLDYTVDKKLWTELISTLIYWTKQGVDGFRFDVASLLPLEFLEEAHEAVLDENPESIFLSESVHGGFLQYIRNQGFGGLSESQIYEVFDMSYDYDVHPYFEGYLKGEVPFSRYIEELERQEFTYPENYIKLRNLENHDFGRFAPMVDNNINKINNWTALMFFQKGSTMIYAGQENCDNNKPSLFDIDKVNWDGNDISVLIKKLSLIAKNNIFAFGIYNIQKTEKDLFVGSFVLGENEIIGIFNVGLLEEEFDLDIPNGQYTNLIDNKDFTVKEGKIKLKKEPLIFYK